MITPVFLDDLFSLPIQTRVECNTHSFAVCFFIDFLKIVFLSGNLETSAQVCEEICSGTGRGRGSSRSNSVQAFRVIKFYHISTFWRKMAKKDSIGVRENMLS